MKYKRKVKKIDSWAARRARKREKIVYFRGYAVILIKFEIQEGWMVGSWVARFDLEFSKL
jgi:hypothetical protein